MRATTIACLLMCLVCSGTSQVRVNQYRQVSVSEGRTAVVGCLVDGDDIQDFHISWFKQLPTAAPIFLLFHRNDSKIQRANSSLGRYQPMRNGSHAHLLQIMNVTAHDSALYWCMLTKNESYPVWGDGTRLSVYGGKDVKAPTVSLLSSHDSVDDSGLLYAACVANGFYPSVIEITWRFEDQPFQGKIISNPFLEEDGQNAYTTISVLELMSQSRRNLSSVSCEVRHDSSRTLIQKDLHQCYRDT
ncbi:immunoglobulin lambda-1 light chain-like [Leptodactylus fuscus]|uniref:immunoglobulin lambda-1 light chain-like n=1 Tax=Leptodactylus fuscus TaxID=238119 RepID=UPI003F4F2F14